MARLRLFPFLRSHIFQQGHDDVVLFKIFFCFYVQPVLEKMRLDQSQSALNIRPAPGKSWSTVRPYERWECDSDYFFSKNISPSLNLFCPNSNTKACAIEALKMCLTCCLQLARAVLPANFPIAAHQQISFVNRKLKNTNKSVPTKVLLLPYGKDMAKPRTWQDPKDFRDCSEKCPSKCKLKGPKLGSGLNLCHEKCWFKNG